MDAGLVVLVAHPIPMLPALLLFSTAWPRLEVPLWLPENLKDVGDERPPLAGLSSQDEPILCALCALWGSGEPLSTSDDCLSAETVDVESIGGDSGLPRMLDMLKDVYWGLQAGLKAGLPTSKLNEWWLFKPQPDFPFFSSLRRSSAGVELLLEPSNSRSSSDTTDTSISVSPDMIDESNVSRRSSGEAVSSCVSTMMQERSPLVPRPSTKAAWSRCTGGPSRQKGGTTVDDDGATAGRHSLSDTRSGSKRGSRRISSVDVFGAARMAVVCCTRSRWLAGTSRRLRRQADVVADRRSVARHS